MYIHVARYYMTPYMRPNVSVKPCCCSVWFETLIIIFRIFSSTLVTTLQLYTCTCLGYNWVSFCFLKASVLCTCTCTLTHTLYFNVYICTRTVYSVYTRILSTGVHFVCTVPELSKGIVAGEDSLLALLPTDAHSNVSRCVGRVGGYINIHANERCKRKEERSKQGQTGKQNKATQHTL